MTRRAVNPWFGIGMDAWRLGLEAGAVITQRSLMLAAGGPAAQAEAARMVSEKVNAGLRLQSMAMTGALGTTPASAASRTLAHYRRKVRANHRRLSKG